MKRQRKYISKGNDDKNLYESLKIPYITISLVNVLMNYTIKHQHRSQQIQCVYTLHSDKEKN